MQAGCSSRVWRGQQEWNLGEQGLPGVWGLESRDPSRFLMEQHWSCLAVGKLQWSQHSPWEGVDWEPPRHLPCPSRECWDGEITTDIHFLSITWPGAVAWLCDLLHPLSRCWRLKAEDPEGAGKPKPLSLPALLFVSLPVLCADPSASPSLSGASPWLRSFLCSCCKSPGQVLDLSPPDRAAVPVTGGAALPAVCSSESKSQFVLPEGTAPQTPPRMGRAQPGRC